MSADKPWASWGSMVVEFRDGLAPVLVGGGLIGEKELENVDEIVG